ncbi:MAG: NAD(P)/FAD-dependent oxidoreductase [Candidatus Sumerlaeia bacterium]|nr:NAD(P)/FAD-dependent oxidoreductase [Candidatus Sumerlaeia bacterium]
MSENQKLTRIVILGGGFAGAYLAQSLERHAKRYNLHITLVDQRNYFIFYPLLVEAGIGSLEPRHAVVSLHQYLKKTTLLMGNVVSVDDDTREVHCQLAGTDFRKALPYDHLVVALGSVTRLPPVPGLGEYGLRLKTMADSVGLRDRAIQLLEIANHLEDPAQRAEWLNLVVVGGSFTGVEFAGEFQAFMAKAANSYPNISGSDVKIHLVEATDRILPALEPSLADYARQHMERRGVDIRLNQYVTRIAHAHAELSNGDKIPTRTVVWCAGIAPNPLLKEMPIPLNEQGYVKSRADLRVEGKDHIWSMGDCASVPSPDGTPYAPTAQNATRQARHAARNILLVLKGEEPEPCRLRALGSLASIGCRSAVASVMGVKLSGFAAWWLWRTVYLMKMPTFSRKIRVMLDWTADLFFTHDVVQLGIHQLRRAEERDKERESGVVDREGL